MVTVDVNILLWMSEVEVAVISRWAGQLVMVLVSVGVVVVTILALMVVVVSVVALMVYVPGFWRHETRY